MLNSFKPTSGYRQSGFFNLPNDNIVKTIGVAVLLCLVCSIIVSTAATVLKPLQTANKLLDKKRNILSVAGIQDAGKSVDELFTQIETKVIDLRTGEYTDAVDAELFDQRKAANDPEFSIVLSKEQDIAQVRSISKYANVYLVKQPDDPDTLSKIIMPVKGYGLWGTLYGFLALESDAQTVSGITFYEHKETPGLGGEVDNQRWKDGWSGKQLANAQGEPVLRLIKGKVDRSLAGAEHQIDGLAGATLTSNGVSNLVEFWMGSDGFGKYLQKLRQQQAKKTLSDSSDLAVR